MNNKLLAMKLFNEKYAVCKLNQQESIPDWVLGNHWYSITRTSDELSIVCLQDIIPDEIECENEWRILEIEGILDFSLIGILSSISSILAKEKISIFVISTYNTDYILVKDKDIARAINTLSANNYEIRNE